MANYLFLLLLVACPLMMVFMMHGMHGGRSGDAGDGHGGMRHDDVTDSGGGDSLDDLRRRREQLDREIEEREASGDQPTPAGGRRR